MEEVLYDSVRSMISLLLTTDDVVKIRTAALALECGRQIRVARGRLLLDVEHGAVREKLAL